MKPEIAYVYNKLKRLRFDFNSSDFENFRSEYRYESTLKRYVRKDDNDLFIDKNTFKPLEEELEYADKCHNLEEQLGCLLEVLQPNQKVEFIKDNEKYIADVMGINIQSKKIMVGSAWSFKELPLNQYKQTWWLKKDRSE